jgi:pyridinium-3,5-biscarboxylic acid mononucleotide synthase
MPAHSALSKILAQYKKGEIPLEAAAEAIEGLRLEHIGDIACLDLGRTVRCGMPEVVLAEGKDPKHLSEIAVRHAEAAGRCVVTRISPEQVEGVRVLAGQKGVAMEYREDARVLILGNGPAPKQTGGIVGIITAGT